MKNLLNFVDLADPLLPPLKHLRAPLNFFFQNRKLENKQFPKLLRWKKWDVHFRKKIWCFFMRYKK
jgi:hypothetical protein